MLFLSVGLGKDSTAIEKIPLNTILQNKDMKSRLYLDIFVDLRYEKCIFIDKIEREQTFSLKFYSLKAYFGDNFKKERYFT